MPVKDYDKIKFGAVTSDSSNSTIDKAQVIELDPSKGEDTVGTGTVGYDETICADAQDIAIYDSNGDLLDYEIENPGDIGTSNSVFVWVYNSWSRDDSDQVIVAYGNNSQNVDRQNVTGTWGNSGQNAYLVAHYDGDANDSTSNGIDGTVNGATFIDNTEVGGGLDLDGTDDWIDHTGFSYSNEPLTIVITANSDQSSSTIDTDGSNQGFVDWEIDGNNNFQISYNGGNSAWSWKWANNFGDTNNFLAGETFSADETIHLVASFDGTDDQTLWLNTVSETIADTATTSVSGTTSFEVGRYDGGSNLDGQISDVRVYKGEEKSSAWKQADYEAMSKGGQTFFDWSAATTTVEKEFLYKREVTVDSVSGTPTVGKAQPVYLGDAINDWSKVDGKEDVAFTDSNGELLKYEIESLNTSNEAGVAWVYSSWSRDGSVQANIVYGDGPGNYEDISGTWSGTNALMVQHLQDDPLTATDSTSNNNDGTVTGATSTNGVFGSAASFDGTDNNIDDIPESMLTEDSAHTIVGWMQLDNTSEQTFVLASDRDNNSPRGIQFKYDGSGFQYFDGNGANTTSTFSWSTGEFYQTAATYDGSGNLVFYQDGVSSSTLSTNHNADSGNVFSINSIPSSTREAYGSGDVDAIRVYQEQKSSDWIQADYDASAKGGKTFFTYGTETSTAELADYNKAKKLSVTDGPTGLETTTEATLDPEAGLASSTSVTFNIDLDAGKRGILSYINDIEGGYDYNVEVQDSNGNVLASESGSAGVRYSVSFSMSDYSRIPDEGESLTVLVESTDGSNIYSDSFLESSSNDNFFSTSGTYPSDNSASYDTIIGIDEVEDAPVEKAQPIILTDGDDSTTGNGDVVIDFTNVNDAQDIAVFDQDGNLLDYEIESIDTTNGTAVLWAYNSWVRDGSTQAQVAYGDNVANQDRQNTENVWNHTGQTVQQTIHDLSNGTDSTSNNNDGTVTGVTQVDGQFANAGRGDDTDDSVDFVTFDDFTTNQFSVSFWMKSSTADDEPWFSMRTSSNAEQILIYPYRTDGELIAQLFFDSGADVDIRTTQNLDDGNWHQVVFTYNAGNGEVYVDGSSVATASGTDSSLSGFSLDNYFVWEDEGAHTPGDFDELKVDSQEKTAEWIQADYDASPKAGQVFFSQDAATSTGTQTLETTFGQDLSIEDRGATKGFTQDLIIENQNIPETFSQDLNVQASDQVKTLDSDVAVIDEDVTKTFTQDVTVKNFDAEKTVSTDVSVQLADQTLGFDQDVVLSAGNIKVVDQDTVLKAEDVTKQVSTDLIIENSNLPEQFNQDVNLLDRNAEASSTHDVSVADLDEEEVFSQDVYVSDRLSESFTSDVVVAKQPAPNTQNPLTVRNLDPTETFVQVLKPSNTYLKVKDVK